MSPPPVLECRSVDAGYPDADGSNVDRVLEGVSFAVERGERWLVLGHSGSGKSTLLRLLNRFDEPLAGDVLFHGRPAAEHDPRDLRRRVAALPQVPVLFAGDVEQNLITRPRGVPAPARAALEAALRDVGLDADFLSRNASALSVGEQQRVAMARALLTEPEVLLLDEPTSALDPRATLLIADLIDTLQTKRELAVVLVTHEPAFVRRLGGKILLLRDGGADTTATADDVERFLDGAAA
jgi:putative ABC transport system ATP-binding protein